VLCGKGSTLASDEFGGTEVDKLDDSVVVKQNV
jgi:hypothetical protein